MPSTTTVNPTPVQTPTHTPAPAPALWPERFTDPLRICEQQRRELASPDIAP